MNECSINKQHCRHTGILTYVTAAAGGTEYSGEVATSNPVVDPLIACGLAYVVCDKT